MTAGKFSSTDDGFIQDMALSSHKLATTILVILLEAGLSYQGFDTQ